MEISHFEVFPFNLHLTFVSCAPRRPTLTAEAFRSQKLPRAIDGISAHLSAVAPGCGDRTVCFFLLWVFCHSATRSLRSVRETLKKALSWSERGNQSIFLIITNDSVMSIKLVLKLNKKILRFSCKRLPFVFCVLQTMNGKKRLKKRFNIDLCTKYSYWFPWF